MPTATATGPVAGSGDYNNVSQSLTSAQTVFLKDVLRDVYNTVAFGQGRDLTQGLEGCDLSGPGPEVYSPAQFALEMAYRNDPSVRKMVCELCKIRSASTSEHCFGVSMFPRGLDVHSEERVTQGGEPKAQ